MNWPELENAFQVGLGALLKGVERQFDPAAGERYLGAGRQQPHEHDTRILFLDRLMELLGWRLGAGGDVVEEARLKAGTTTFMDYVGINADTQVPVLVFEAKAWDKPLVRPRNGARAQATHRQLIVEALEHIAAKGTKITSPVTGDWHDNLEQVAGYVRDLKDQHDHEIPRVVLGTGRWLLVFSNPVKTFVQGRVDEADFRLFVAADFVTSACEIHTLLSRARLACIAPRLVRPAQLSDYLAPDQSFAAFHAVSVKYESSGSSAFTPKPRVLVYPVLLLEAADGPVLTVMKEDPELIMGLDRFSNESEAGLRSHLVDVGKALVALAQECTAELSRKVEPQELSTFRGFSSSGITSAAAGSAVGARQDLVQPVGAGDEWVLAVGLLSHFLLEVPTITCRFHAWSEARAAGHPAGKFALSTPSTATPRAFFVDGSPYHCAHQKVLDRRKSRCLIAPIDSRVCCLACVYQDICWTAEEKQVLPCGS